MLKPSPDLIGGVLQTKENNTLKNYMCYNDKMFFLGIKRNSHFINFYNCFDENFQQLFVVIISFCVTKASIKNIITASKFS